MAEGQRGGSSSWERFSAQVTGATEAGRVALPELEPLPKAVERAAELVVGDIQGSKPLPIGLSYLASSEDSKLGMVVVRIGRDVYGFGVDRTASSAELIFGLAEGIQEHLSETALAWGEARPVCARHRHPASPEIAEGAAYWICPQDGLRLAEIGALRRGGG